MPVRNQTQWAAPSGTGFVTPSDSDDITTQAGTVITTEALDDIIINPETWQPKYQTDWTLADKEDTIWQDQTVVTVGAENLSTNLSELLTDNLGNYIVTTTTYDTPKSQTVWTASGA